MSLKNAFEFINGLSAARTLAQENQGSDLLHTLVTQSVPASLAERVIHARVSGDRLRVTVDNQAVATRVRFLSNDILSKINAKGYPAKTLSVHVKPMENKQFLQMRSKAKPAKPTAGAVDAVDKLANGIEDDELESALQRLSRAMRGAASKRD